MDRAVASAMVGDVWPGFLIPAAKLRNSNDAVEDHYLEPLGGPGSAL